MLVFFALWVCDLDMILSLTFQYVESLESSVQDLQSKVIRLQQENATLRERPVSVSPSLEEREAQEVMTLKVKKGQGTRSYF